MTIAEKMYLFYENQNMVKLVTKNGKSFIGKIGLYEDEYDSGDGEPCIGIDLDISPNLFALNEISSLEAIN